MAAKHDTLMASHSQDKMEWLKQQNLGYLINLDTNDTTEKDYYVDGVWYDETTLPANAIIDYRREWEVNSVVLLPTPTYNKSSSDFNNTVMEITVRCYAYKYKKDTELRWLEFKTYRRSG